MASPPITLKQAVTLRREAWRLFEAGKMEEYKVADRIASEAYVQLSASDQRAFLRRVKFETVKR